MPRICVAIQGESMDIVIEGLLRSGQADLIEIRLDYRLEPLDLDAIRNGTGKPLIATNRRRDQGGYADETESERIQLLCDAVEAGFEYVDLGSTTEKLGNTVSKMQTLGAKVIVSHHDFDNPIGLDQLEEIHQRLAKTGCDIIKIIGWTSCYEDNLPYLEYNKRYPGNVSFGMGELGVTSRILAPLSGAEYTYASLESGQEVASGQVPLNALWETYRRITG